MVVTFRVKTAKCENVIFWEVYETFLLDKFEKFFKINILKEDEDFL